MNLNVYKLYKIKIMYQMYQKNIYITRNNIRYILTYNCLLFIF